MPRGKPSPKLAITVDADVHAGVMAAAAEDGVSVSAWMTNTARQSLLVRDGLVAVAEWEAEHGPLSESEMAAARSRRFRTAGDANPSAASPSGVSAVYDAGALIAADRSARRLWVEHRARLELGVIPVTTVLIYPI
jgi:hypothetical protein